MIVELKRAGVPRILMPYVRVSVPMPAVHYWFVTETETVRERWEIWQSPDAGETSVGHLHRNLMEPDADVGGSPTRLECRWSGERARRIAGTLQRSWDEYPHRHRYRAWPGPNSNTFVAWIFREAGIEHRLSWMGLGKRYVWFTRPSD